MATLPVPAPFALPPPVASAPTAVAPKPVASSSAPSNNGVYWIGSNGLVYVKGSNGTNAAGQADANTSNYWGSRGFSQIADPNAPQQTQNITGAGGSASTSGGSGYVAPTDADTAPLLASLSHLDEILNNRNTQSQQEHDAAVSSYDAQDALDHQAIDQNTHQNETNLTSDDWKALLNAANGATGLRGTLASIGALAGSGNDVVRRLTGLAASSDQGAAHKTFESNAGQINQAAAQTTQQEAQRRKDAEATLSNAFQDNKANVLTSKQDIYQKLASLYGSGTSQGNSYASQAASLAAPIAETTHAAVAPYAAASSLYSPQALATYLAGTQNLTTSASPSTSTDATPINSPSYVSTTKKDATLAGVA